MKTLYRYKKRLFTSFGLCYRCFSAIVNEIPIEELVLADISFHASKLRSLVQLCARNKAAIEGKACHGQIIHVGLQTDTLTSNMLINMYSKCCLIDSARKVFDEMPERSLVSWNTMIGLYTQTGQGHVAVTLFTEMQREGTSVTEFTISSLVCACAAKCAVLECKQLHGFSIKASIDSNEFVGTALLDVYAKSGLVKDASLVFESMPKRSDVTWSSMLAAYVQNELYNEALLLFRRAQNMGLKHNEYSISSAVCACAGLVALNEGNRVHAILCKAGFAANIFVASSLIDMYAKCGSIGDAYSVFSNVEGKNIVSWNAMISGFARHACSMEAMILFEKLQQTGMWPNEVTYVSVLSACSHKGFVEMGRKYIDLMRREHNVSPNALHYSCMVDILSRAGRIHEAYELIEKMPFDATAPMWGSLLASCKNHGNLELAEVAAKHLFEMEPENAGNHVLLSNMYSAEKRWEEVARARKLLKEREVKKVRGKSWVELKDNVHTFMAGERNHSKISDIYVKLENLVEEVKKTGYKVETEHDLHDVEDSRKQELLRHHSEKLALAFGLMCLPPGVPIRIMKNLRICGDCHSFMRFASSLIGREIIVRDINRFHHFRNGCCSCGEFW